MRRLRAIGMAGGGSLIAAVLLLAPALAMSGGSHVRSRQPAASSERLIGSFTPAVSDPRLAAMLTRRGANFGDLRFTPAASTASDRARDMRVAVRAHAAAPTDPISDPIAAVTTGPAATITPSSYNLGVSLGWRRFAIAGDVAESDGGLVPGRREAAQVGVSYRANRRLTGRVAIAAERNEGAQRLIAPDESYSLDVGGAFSITRHIDVTAGARYRIARDRADALTRDERRDSQAVYIGTAFRF